MSISSRSLLALRCNLAEKYNAANLRPGVRMKAREALGERYGCLTLCNIALALLTGCKFTFGVDEQVICSGLVARCLERTSSIFAGAASNISRADLARQFGVELVAA